MIKASFLGSGRYGNGIVVAQLADGTWSAPSAIGLGGAGFGGQIGFELTDFVFVLNDAPAVRAFSQLGSLTLGGNVSLAAGPVGRNAEAAGAASLKGVAGVFSYSKTKGLFAGVSLEGSVVVERRDTNKEFYGMQYKASELMEGIVRPPPAATPLMSVLNSRVFSGVGRGDDSIYNDVPNYDDRHDDYTYSDSPSSGKAGLGRPVAPKPQSLVSKIAGIEENQAVALFTFHADQPGDLGFKKGDIITVTKKTDKAEDWWYVI